MVNIYEKETRKQDKVRDDLWSYACNSDDDMRKIESYVAEKADVPSELVYLFLQGSKLSDIYLKRIEDFIVIEKSVKWEIEK